MFQSIEYKGTMEENYSLLNKQLAALLSGENHLIANLSSASSLLNVFLKDINWVGFYLFEDNGLVLGPFQGLPACIRIPLGKGVCGTAAQAAKTIIVDDVDQFPGHIACDAASKSEIVIPIFKDGSLIAVLDIDSPLAGRFSKEEANYLEQFAKVLEASL